MLHDGLPLSGCEGVAAVILADDGKPTDVVGFEVDAGGPTTMLGACFAVDVCKVVGGKVERAVL